jgi:hypothetical protein
MQTFIFVHDQNIVIDFINSDKFSNIENVKYVFVGDKPVDKIKDLSEVIICRDLKNNIENYPNLTSFTGWYALWKNNLIKSDYINLFEYDINFSSDLVSQINNSYDEGYDIIGYIPLKVRDFNYIGHLQYVEKIISSLNSVYQINLYDLVLSLDEDTSVSMTSNHSMKKETFDKYMNWISPMVDEIKLSYFSGHEVERSISIFYLLSKLKYKILEGKIQHFQFNSHGTQEISQDKFKNNYQKLL